MTDGAYLYHPTEHFSARLKKIRTHDPSGHKRIMDVVNRLLRNPSDADGQMHGDHRGKFKKYVGRGEYRIIYLFCDLCRKAQRHLPKDCDSCSPVPDNSVVFFDVFHKNENKKLPY